MRCRASDLLDLHSATPVHNFRSGVYLVIIIRACRKDQHFSVPQSPDVSLRLSFRCPDPPEFPHQLQFKFDVCDLHDAGDGEVQRLTQSADMISRQTYGFNLSDNLIHELRIVE